MMQPDLNSYDFIILAFSGGKDSVACLLHLIEQGAPLSKIELWHHNVDGEPGAKPFMDWPCTHAYCSAVARAFAVGFYTSWREGGFEREMLRNGTPTAPTFFEDEHHVIQTKGGQGKPGTRMKFPQVSADLSVRWCSAYLKIDVGTIAIKNQPRFRGRRTLFISGERAQESPARAKYKQFEPHRTDNRDGESKRYVDHWRPIHQWPETEVWRIIERHRVIAHPAYRLGWGRVSCLACIFGSANQWASVKQVAPTVFGTVANYERVFGLTIHRNLSVEQQAAKGHPYPAALNQAVLAEALDTNWNRPVILAPGEWVLPAGAFGESTGPT